MTTSELVSFIGMGMGAITFIGGGIAWYKGSVEKRYASERDFAHIRRNQEQILVNLDHYLHEQEQRFNQLNGEMVKVQAVLMAVLAKSGDSISGILRDRE